MPRYFFNIRSGDDLTRDPDGTELDTLEQARSEADESARELLAAAVKAGRLVNGQTFEVTDETGAVAFTLPFKDAIRLP